MATPATRRRGFTFVDLLLTLLLLLLVAAAAVPTAVQQWETANRVECARSLRQIGQAMRQYAIDDIRAGGFPRTLYDSKAAGKPVFATPYDADGEPGPRKGVDPFVTAEVVKRNKALEPLLPHTPEANDITAALFHLLRQSDLTADLFTCPSTLQKPFAFAPGFDKAAYTNWAGTNALRDGLSYSFQNMYANVEGIGRGFRWTDSLRANFAIAADMNPGGGAVLALDGQSDADQMRAANSHNHFGDGQNVLYADGSVRFVSGPMAGPQNDNIYAFSGPSDDPRKAVDPLDKSAGIVGSPSTGSDNVLLPTAELIGQKARPMPAEDQVKAAE